MAAKHGREKNEVKRILRKLLGPPEPPPREPDEGAYWWIPVPSAPSNPQMQDKQRLDPEFRVHPTMVRWVALVLLATEYEDVEDETLHPARWGEVVGALSVIWSIPNLSRLLVGCHQGLPRGRVAINNEGGYTIDHGDNNPAGTRMTTIAENFGIRLGGANRLETYDPRFHHYDLDQKALLKIETGLGVSLRDSDQ